MKRAIAALIALVLPVAAQAVGLQFNGTFFQGSKAWARPGAYFDLDFAYDRYVFNGATYYGLSNLLSANGGTFSRSSSGTFFGSNGLIQTAANDTPRFEYDPSKGFAKGLLIEEATTNLALDSGDLTMGWTASNVSVTTGALAPDGSATATIANALGSGLTHIHQIINGLAGSTVSYSVFAKAGTQSHLYFELTDTGGCGANCVVDYDLNAISLSTNAPSLYNLRIIDVGNGWRRLEATVDYSSASSGQNRFLMYVGGYGTGNGTILLWGAQVEKHPSVTSYVPTNSVAPSTRSADTFRIPTAGWYDTSHSTFYAESYGDFNIQQIGYSRVLGTETGAALLAFGAPNTDEFHIWNGSIQITTSLGRIFPATTYLKPVRAAFAFDSASSTATVVANGNAMTSSYPGNWNATAIHPGGSSTNPLNACITRLTYFPVRLDNASLKGMTQQ